MRNYRSFKPINGYNKNEDITDRVLSAMSYITSGMVGFIWLIVYHVQGKSLSLFARYNIFQSIMLSILMYIGSIVYSILFSVLQILPLIGGLSGRLDFLLTKYPLVWGYSIMHFTLMALFLYLAIYAFLGEKPRVPYISDMVGKMS